MASLKLLVLAFLLICFAGFPDQTLALQYTYTEILPAGWSRSYAHGINDNGDIVGYGEVNSIEKSFLYSNGLVTELIPPNWTSAYALTINSGGEIVGYGMVSGSYKAFLYINGSYTELLPSGWSWAWGIRINDNGDVVGGGNNNGNPRGFLYSNEVYTELLPSGWSASTAYGINSSGVIAGWGTDGQGVEKGFIYRNGLYTELLPPGWISATAYNINENNEVIGEGVDGDGNAKGYIYNNGEYTELLPNGWTDVVPEDINDSGVAAGYGTDGADGNIVKGFVYSNGTYLILTSPLSPNTTIIGINNNREVVGLAYNPGRGFVSTLCSAEIINNGIDDDCDPETPEVSISGNGKIGYKGHITVNVSESSLQTGIVRYKNKNKKIHLVSTSITMLTIEGSSATIAGKGRVNGKPNYSFTLSMSKVNGSIEQMRIEIDRPNGKPYYEYPKTNMVNIKGSLAAVDE